MTEIWRYKDMRMEKIIIRIIIIIIIINKNNNNNNNYKNKSIPTNMMKMIG